MSSGLFNNVINKICLEIIYLIDIYKKNLASNNLQGLICRKTKPNISIPGQSEPESSGNEEVTPPSPEQQNWILTTRCSYIS